MPECATFEPSVLPCPCLFETVSRYSPKLGVCSLPVYSVHYSYAVLDVYSMCVILTHTLLQLPPLSMYLQSKWEMVILNFSAGRCRGFRQSLWDAGAGCSQAYVSETLWYFWGSMFRSVRCPLQRNSQQNTKYCCYLNFFEMKRKCITFYLIKQKKVILHEMLIVNMSKISPKCSVYQMWANVRSERSFWGGLRWVEAPLWCLWRYPEIRFYLLWTSLYQEWCCCAGCQSWDSAGAVCSEQEMNFEVQCRQQMFLFLLPSLQQPQTLSAELTCSFNLEELFPLSHLPSWVITPTLHSVFT